MSRSAKKPPDWRSYQQSELDKTGLLNLKMAFPGSLLCNHILVPASKKIDIDSSTLQVPDVSHVLYEYCDGNRRYELLENSLLLDIEEPSNADSVACAVEQKLKDLDVRRIVLLGNSAYERYEKVMHSHLGQSIEIVVFEPDWMSASMLHSVYRQAEALLFINTMRVLDAAICGCQCALIAGEKFQAQAAFAALHQFLHSRECTVADESGLSVLEPASTIKVSYQLVDNSLSAVRLAYRAGTAAGEINNDSDTDWYGELDSNVAVPVIKPYSSNNTMVSGLRDRRTLISRKAAKLIDNPSAFFRDSRYTALRTIGRAFRRKSVDI